jgi:hypothetical protein
MDVGGINTADALAAILGVFAGAIFVPALYRRSRKTHLCRNGVASRAVSRIA